MAEMEKNLQSPEQMLKTIQIIRVALLAGPVGFMGIVLFLASFPLKFQTDILFFVAIFLTIQCLVLAFAADRLFAKKPKNWNQQSDADHQNSLASIALQIKLIQGALLEGPTFFWLVLLLTNNNAFGLFFALILMAIAAFLFPTKNRFFGLIDKLYERFRA
jgi:hypothetical protein